MNGAPRVAVLVMLLFFALFLGALSVLAFRWPGGGKMALAVALILVSAALLAGGVLWYFGIFSHLF